MSGFVSLRRKPESRRSGVGGSLFLPFLLLSIVALALAWLDSDSPASSELGDNPLFYLLLSFASLVYAAAEIRRIRG